MTTRDTFALDFCIIASRFGTVKNNRKTPTSIEYTGSNLEAIYFSEGRLIPRGTAFNYTYTIKDHLGNARISFRANGTAISILQENHYYPFGLDMEGSWQAQVGTENAYQYNSKELNEDFGLNWYDYGARWYDAAVGRWWSVDPLGEKSKDVSTYAYVRNSPLLLVDPTGMISEAFGFYYTSSSAAMAEKMAQQEKSFSLDDHVYLNKEGKEIGRIKDENVKKVTIIEDENLQKFDNLPYGRESMEEAAAMGVTYDMTGIISLFNNSASDKVTVDSKTHLDKDGNLLEDARTGKAKQGIANEHGMDLKLINNEVTGVGYYKGSPINVIMGFASKYNDIIGTVHTHPNEGKGAVRINNGMLEFNNYGPSQEYDLKSLGAPRPGYYNIVIDKSNVYFYNRELQQNKIITLPRSKL